jgi:hypothetical protein
VIEHSIRKNKNGESVLTIRVTGGNEIFRFAYHLAQGQIEFGAVGRAAFRYLRRQWGIAQFKATDQVMTGGRVVKWGYQRDEVRD